jgi:hypothetical protein
MEARTSGFTPGRARDLLATTAALGKCPATGSAVASGAVSLTQAREIVVAEAAVPGAEAALLEVAGSTRMAGLREASRKVRLAALDREELSRRQWSARSVRHWVDEDGMVVRPATFSRPALRVPGGSPRRRNRAARRSR